MAVSLLIQDAQVLEIGGKSKTKKSKWREKHPLSLTTVIYIKEIKLLNCVIEKMH